MGIVVVSAVCFERPDGTVLTVRKRGTEMYMLPGGKPEPGEDDRECAIREVREELGVCLGPGEVCSFGVWEADAANEPGVRVRASVFRTRSHAHPVVQAEIDDLRWVQPGEALTDPTQAPLTREHVFPRLLDERASPRR